MNTSIKSTLFDMPIDPAQWAKWLEPHLVGLELGQLVAELAHCQSNELTDPKESAEPETSSSPSLEEVLGDDLETVLRDGLGGLPQPKLNTLLRRPALLLPLQERIVVEGGAYWQSVPRSQQQQAKSRRGWEALQAAMADEAATEETVQDVEPVAMKPTRPASDRQISSTMFVWSGIAAMLLAAIGLAWWAQSPAGVGFDRAGLMTAKVDAKSHLNALADAADDYAIPSTADKATVRKQIVQFRKGCDTLQNASHEQLAATDRDWLKERCKVWSDKLDDFLVALDSDKKSLDEIRSGVEETRTKMIAALRGRLAA